MKTINLKLTGNKYLNELLISVDGKPMKFRKNEFKNTVCTYQTDKESVHITIVNMLDTGGLIWFITQLFFFLISIFGIFDTHRKERCLLADFDVKVNLRETDNDLTLRLNMPEANKKVASIDTNLSVLEISNQYFLHEQAKRKRKILFFTKIGLTIAVIVIVLCILLLNQ